MNEAHFSDHVIVNRKASGAISRAGQIITKLQPVRPKQPAHARVSADPLGPEVRHKKADEFREQVERYRAIRTE
jgi:hypothetical protein